MFWSLDTVYLYTSNLNDSSCLSAESIKHVHAMLTYVLTLYHLEPATLTALRFLKRGIELLMSMKYIILYFFCYNVVYNSKEIALQCGVHIRKIENTKIAATNSTP